MTIFRRRGLGTFAFDVPLAMAVGLVGIVITGRFAAEGQVPPREALDALGAGLVGVAAGALALRRRWPFITLAVTVVAMGGYLAGNYPYGPALLPLGVAIYTVGAERSPRRSLPAVAVGLVGLLIGHLFAPGPGRSLIDWAGNAAWASAWLALPWAIGTLVRLRRESVQRSLEEQAHHRAYEERLRIAREIHDVVGHGLAVINMQAGVALHVIDKRPGEARNALGAIRQTSKDALDELRGTLAVFRRDENGSEPRHPEPGLDQLDSLVSAMAEGGLRVEVATLGDPMSLPAAVDLAAYRIVQESLTNVLRHSGSDRARVAVSYPPHGRSGEIDIEVLDRGYGRPLSSERPTGHGIVGMRERAAAVGGVLEAGPRPEGGFRVHASLPLRDGRR